MVADGVVDGFDKAHAVGERGVRAVVERREELLEDTHRRPGEVDPVVAGRGGPIGRSPEIRGQFVDLGRR